MLKTYNQGLHEIHERMHSGIEFLTFVVNILLLIGKFTATLKFTEKTSYLQLGKGPIVDPILGLEKSQQQSFN